MLSLFTSNYITLAISIQLILSLYEGNRSFNIIKKSLLKIKPTNRIDQYMMNSPRRRKILHRPPVPWLAALLIAPHITAMFVYILMILQRCKQLSVLGIFDPQKQDSYPASLSALDNQMWVLPVAYRWNTDCRPKMSKDLSQVLWK